MAEELGYSQFAANPYGALSKPLNYTDTYSPTAKTYHGIAIEVGGNVLGRIQSWNPAPYGREGVHIYELNNMTWGKPVDYVPGRATGFSVTATVAELWFKEIEVQLSLTNAGTQFNDLIDQNIPFTCREFWFRGADTYRVWTYVGCWLTDRNEEGYTAEGDARVIANFTFNYVSRRMTGSGTATS
jgi:hypothetical protein